MPEADMYADRDDQRGEFIERYKMLMPERSVYIHYKGGVYEHLGEGQHTETGEKLVAYRHLWPHLTWEWKFRPTENFHGTVPLVVGPDEDTIYVQRFQEV